MYVVVRIIRIWPGLFMVTMFFAGPAIFFASGPNQKAFTKGYLESCRERWWWDLTFFNNFIESGFYNTADDKTQACLGQSWYVCVDFQMYIVLPFLILPMKLFRWKQAYMWLLTLISCMIPGYFTLKYNLGPAETFDHLFSQAHNLIYVKPWCRATPFFVGGLCALWMIKFERSGKTGPQLLNDFYKRHPLIAAIYPRIWGWLICTAVALACVFGLVEHNNFTNTYKYTWVESFTYSSFAIFAWSMVLAWVVMMCTMGLAEPLNYLLSHPMWQPLARLSFGVYLVSQPLQLLVFSTFPTGFVYYSFNMVLLLLGGIIILSFMGAYALSILAESPAINILRLIR